MEQKLIDGKPRSTTFEHFRYWIVLCVFALGLVVAFLLIRWVLLKPITLCSSLQVLDYKNDDVSFADNRGVTQYSFLDLAWWHEGYTGLFPEQESDYFSWETDPFVISVSKVVPNHMKPFAEKRITIAVIDTGFDVSMIPQEMVWRPILDGESNWDGLNSIERKNGMFENASLQECCFFRVGTQYASSHGTLILNLLAGKNKSYRGLLCESNIQVMLLSVLDDNGNCSIAQLIDAIEFAEQNGASICNLSLSTYVDDYLLRAAIYDSNMLFVVPAGNDGVELGEYVSYPCVYGYENVISVASMRSDGCISKTSNFGELYVDIAAPGTDVVSLTGNGEMQLCNGTSFAVPFVVAEVAIIESNTNMSLGDLKRIVIKNAVTLPELSHRVQSGGYVNFHIMEP